MKKLYPMLSVALMMILMYFALINNAPITVNFFGIAELKSNVTIVMLGCLACGVITGPLILYSNKHSGTEHS